MFSNINEELEVNNKISAFEGENVNGSCQKSWSSERVLEVGFSAQFRKMSHQNASIIITAVDFPII